MYGRMRVWAKDGMSVVGFASCGEAWSFAAGVVSSGGGGSGAGWRHFCMN